MTIGTILIIVLILLLIGALPSWPYSRPMPTEATDRAIAELKVLVQ